MPENKSVRKKALTATDFVRWEAALEAESQLHLIDREAPSTEEYQSTGMAAVHTLDEIFQRIRTEAGLRDNWEETKVRIRVEGIEVSNRASKIATCFSFGVNWDHFELKSSLRHFGFLNNVGDEFWLELGLLFNVGKVTLETGDLQRSISSKEGNRTLLRNESSVVFRMIRNHILATQEKETPQVLSLNLSWPRTNPLEEVLPKAIEGFALLYKLEYRLYRCAYLATRQTVKRVMKKQGWHGSVKEHMPRIY